MTLAAVGSVPPGVCRAQVVSQRGFVEPRLFLFAEQAANDPTQAVADLLARDEVFAKPASWVQFAGGVDLRVDSHGRVEDSWDVDFTDRTARRPRLSVRRLTATLTRGPLTVDIGKQFIRWGRTDIINPTDHFAPRDFLDVVDNDFLGVIGARAVTQVGSDTLDLVWLPWFTPSRIPLLNQRWTIVPEQAAGIPLVDVTRDFPGRSQVGVRWNHPGAAFEYSLSAFDGFNHLPNIESSFSPEPLAIDVRRIYPEMRSYGGDAAVPTRWFLIKGEAAYATSTTPATDEYVLYVVQLERQAGEWTFVGGYAGEVVTEQRANLTFAPDRGLAKSIVGRISHTVDPNRSFAFETAVKQDGRGVWVKGEYSQARGDHWRVTATGVVIGGHSDDFLGQYHDNSHVLLTARYSF